MKKYYLNDSPVYFQHFQDFDDIIIWIYRYNGKTLYSTAYNELIVKNFIDDFETLYLN